MLCVYISEKKYTAYMCYILFRFESSIIMRFLFFRIYLISVITIEGKKELHSTIIYNIYELQLKIEKPQL